jgi:hypothetical protein
MVTIMKAKLSAVVGTVSAVFLAFSIGASPAAAQECASAIQGAKAEWHTLSSGNRRIAPGMQIVTSDGRRLSGATINYAGILLDQAAFRCADPEPAKAMAYLTEAESLLHPAAR